MHRKEIIYDIKNCTSCNACGETGHWSGDNEPNMQGQRNKNILNNNSQDKENRESSHTANVYNPIYHATGPMVDDCAPYFVIGMDELFSPMETIKCN